MAVVKLTVADNGTPWTVPAGVTVLTRVRVVGGGGGGGGSDTGENGAGGGGGAYSDIVDLAVTPEAEIDFTVGAGGAGGGVGANGSAGGDTFFGDATLGGSDVGAKGGTGGTAAGTSTGGTGGAAASGVGTTKTSGGNGAGSDFRGGGGGGGAGGPSGDGGNGGTGANGNGDSGGGGGGGANNGADGEAAGTDGANQGGDGGASDGAGGDGGAADDTPGAAGTNGGGGGGGARNTTSTSSQCTGGAGGAGDQLTPNGGYGGGGGGGGGSSVFGSPGGDGGLHGGGGGGAGLNQDAAGVGGDGGAGAIWIEYDDAPAGPFGDEGYVPTTTNPATAADAEWKHVDDVLDTDYLPTCSDPDTAADAEWKQLQDITLVDFLPMVDDPVAPTVGAWLDGDERDLGIEVLTEFTFETIANQQVDNGFLVTVKARNQFGQVMTSFVDTVDFSSDGSLSAGGGTSAAFTAGVLVHEVEFDAIDDDISLSVEDTDTGLITGQSNTFDIVDAGQFPPPGFVISDEFFGDDRSGMQEIEFEGDSIQSVGGKTRTVFPAGLDGGSSACIIFPNPETVNADEYWVRAIYKLSSDFYAHPTGVTKQIFFTIQGGNRLYLCVRGATTGSLTWALHVQQTTNPPDAENYTTSAAAVRNQVYTIDIYVRVNTPGNEDGEIRLFVDGVEQTLNPESTSVPPDEIQWTLSGAVQMDTARIDPTWGGAGGEIGSGGVPSDFYMEFDYFGIAIPQ